MQKLCYQLNIFKKFEHNENAETEEKNHFVDELTITANNVDFISIINLSFSEAPRSALKTNGRITKPLLK